MFCPKCGEIVRETALKCPCCGASLRGGQSKINKDCDHHHAEPDTVESPRTWQNPSKWDDPQATVKIFGQTITKEKVDAFRQSFSQAHAETYRQAYTQEQFSSKAEEIIALMKRFFLGYKDFSGRTSRREFWVTMAIVFFISLFLSIFAPFGVLTSLALLMPCVAMSVRRLHDTGLDTSVILLVFLPFIGIIMVGYYLTKESAPSNQWGSRPVQ